LIGYHDVANEQLNQARKLQMQYENALELSKKSVFYTKIGVFIALVALVVAVAVVVFDVELKSLRQAKNTPELITK
jgi:hypothetical protein